MAPEVEDWGFLGTLPQWGMFAAAILLLLVTLLKILPGIRAQSLESKQQDVVGWREECHKLRQELLACEELCEQKLAAAHRKIERLYEEVWGEKKQRVAEQISLINIIIKSVNAPELNMLREMLERVQVQLITQQRKGIEDVEGT